MEDNNMNVEIAEVEQMEIIPIDEKENGTDLSTMLVIGGIAAVGAFIGVGATKLISWGKRKFRENREKKGEVIDVVDGVEPVTKEAIVVTVEEAKA